MCIHYHRYSCRQILRPYQLEQPHLQHDVQSSQHSHEVAKTKGISTIKLKATKEATSGILFQQTNRPTKATISYTKVNPLHTAQHRPCLLLKLPMVTNSILQTYTLCVERLSESHYQLKMHQEVLQCLHYLGLYHAHQHQKSNEQHWVQIQP